VLSKCPSVETVIFNECKEITGKQIFRWCSLRAAEVMQFVFLGAITVLKKCPSLQNAEFRNCEKINGGVRLILQWTMPRDFFFVRWHWGVQQLPTSSDCGPFSLFQHNW
jgi:hypothetical protein